MRLHPLATTQEDKQEQRSNRFWHCGGIVCCQNWFVSTQTITVQEVRKKGKEGGARRRGRGLGWTSEKWGEEGL